MATRATTYSRPAIRRILQGLNEGRADVSVVSRLRP